MNKFENIIIAIRKSAIRNSLKYINLYHWEEIVEDVKDLLKKHGQNHIEVVEEWW